VAACFDGATPNHFYSIEITISPAASDYVSDEIDSGAGVLRDSPEGAPAIGAMADLQFIYNDWSAILTNSRLNLIGSGSSDPSASMA
jgi:hypothetical protein